MLPKDIRQYRYHTHNITSFRSGPVPKVSRCSFFKFSNLRIIFKFQIICALRAYYSDGTTPIYYVIGTHKIFKFSYFI